MFGKGGATGGRSYYSDGASNGGDATGYGSGGSGAVGKNATAYGGNGAPGCVRITYLGV